MYAPTNTSSANSPIPISDGFLVELSQLWTSNSIADSNVFWRTAVIRLQGGNPKACLGYRETAGTVIAGIIAHGRIYFWEIPTNAVPVETPKFGGREGQQYYMPPIPEAVYSEVRNIYGASITLTNSDVMHLAVHTTGGNGFLVRHLTYSFKDKQWALLPLQKDDEAKR